MVILRNFQTRPIVPATGLRSVAAAVRERTGQRDGAVGFAFVDDRRMSDYHKRFSGDDSTTDVLSFPDELGDAAVGAAPVESAEEAPYWGDVIICTDQAARQARRLGLPYQYELIVLAIHGLLHLAGYDHTRDAGRMSRMEDALRPVAWRAGGLA